VTHRPDVTYVLPIRQARLDAALVDELRAYLRSIRGACQAVVVVDGSAEPVFAAHHVAWAGLCQHVQPDPRYRYLNGKVNGLLTGVDCATTDKIIGGDDDVRYRPAEIQRLSRLLDRFDYVKPQNYFDPLPLHARVDTARMLVNRAVLRTGDYPGTCGFRKSVLERIGPYDGNVLFENEEMFRHFARHGAAMGCANDFPVRRLPPTLAKFLEQRPRQSYEDLVMRRKTALFASFLPIVAALVLAGRWRSAAAYFAAWCLAAVGLAARGRRGLAARVFPWSSCLFAVPWVLERGVSVYVALYWKLARGGLPYWGRTFPNGTGAAFARASADMREVADVAR
jgi:hypothetical protein